MAETKPGLPGKRARLRVKWRICTFAILAPSRRPGNSARINPAVAREETFGPVAPVTRFDGDVEAVVARANASPYGLAAYVYGRDIGQIVRVTEGLEYGMVAVNAVALGAEVAPIGGFKESGLGREGSHHGILEYCEMKYVLLGGI